MEILEKVEQLKAELDALLPLDPEIEVRIWQKFRLDWNYHSNKLEGNTYSYGETRMLLVKGLTAGGKPIRDHEEISGHDEAISFILDSIKEDQPLTETFIRHLHKLILVRPFWTDAVTPESQPTRRLIRVGEYKTEPNHVLTQTGDTFYFAEPIETPAKMQELVEWFRKTAATPGTNPILLATELHYRFVRIHPFDDGNGRMARLLMNFVLMKFDYPPVIVKNEDKDDYIAVLEQADFEILQPFVEFIAMNQADSLELMIRGAAGENIEEPGDIDKEITILEKQIRGFGKRIQLPKSPEAVREVLEHSIFLLAQKFFAEFRVFDKFYLENRALLYIDGVAVAGEYDNALHDARRTLEDRPGSPINQVILRYLNNGFTQNDFGNFQYEANLIVDFELTKYRVAVSGNQWNIEKLYTEQLSAPEIQSLIDAEKQFHLDLIKKKKNDLEGSNL